MGLSLGFLSFSIGLYFCFYAGTMLSWWLYLCSIVWSQEGWFLQLFLFLKIVLAIQGLLCFHTNCEFFCFSSVKNTNPRTWCISPSVCVIFDFFHPKHLLMMQSTQARSLDWEDPLEKEMGTHSSILAWKTPWTEEPGRSQRVGHTWATSFLTFQYLTYKKV